MAEKQGLRLDHLPFELRTGFRPGDLILHFARPGLSRLEERYGWTVNRSGLMAAYAKLAIVGEWFLRNPTFDELTGFHTAVVDGNATDLHARSILIEQMATKPGMIRAHSHEFK